MQGYNIIMVYSACRDKILMCRRLKEPYLGLDNFVGGKIEAGEDGFDAAYRELFEETCIKRDEIELSHVMDFKYYYQDCYVEVYAGVLRCEKEVSGSENTLFWSDLDHNFFDMSKYAGEGNIGHMLEQVKMYSEEILK